MKEERAFRWAEDFRDEISIGWELFLTWLFLLSHLWSRADEKPNQEDLQPRGPRGLEDRGEERQKRERGGDTHPPNHTSHDQQERTMMKVNGTRCETGEHRPPDVVESKHRTEY